MMCWRSMGILYFLHRYAVRRAEGPVHRIGEPGGVTHIALMLDAYAGLVVGPITRMVSDVLLFYRLSYLSIGGTYSVVARSAGSRVSEPVYGTGPRALWVTWIITLFMLLEPGRLALL